MRNYVFYIPEIEAQNQNICQLLSFPFEVWCINYLDDFRPWVDDDQTLRVFASLHCPIISGNFPQNETGLWVPLVNAVNKWCTFSRWS